LLEIGSHMRIADRPNPLIWLVHRV
jgi:hypothetical protein